MPASRGVLVAHQPAYLPWCGYFSRLLDVDKMVILDHVQFSERGYQHRNRIPTTDGTAIWLTVPVHRRFGQSLLDVRIADPIWSHRHWLTLRHTYCHAPFWAYLADHLEGVYAQNWTHLTDLNIALTQALLDALALDVTLIRSSTIRPAGVRTQMLIDLCRHTGDRTLRVGTGALTYLDHSALHAAEIGIQVATYRNPQPAEGPALSIVDVLARHGPGARQILNVGATVTAPVTS